MVIPVNYRIKVDGRVPDGWLDRLGGMQIIAGMDNEVVLEGPVPDQAALVGVLNTLYQLRLCLLEVTCLGPSQKIIGKAAVPY